MLLEISSIFILQGFFVNHYNQSIYQKVSGRIQINLDKGRRRSYFLPTQPFPNFISVQPNLFQILSNQYLSLSLYLYSYFFQKIPYFIWTIIIHIMYLYFCRCLCICIYICPFQISFQPFPASITTILFLTHICHICVWIHLYLFIQTKESYLYSMK